MFHGDKPLAVGTTPAARKLLSPDLFSMLQSTSGKLPDPPSGAGCLQLEPDDLRSVRPEIIRLSIKEIEHDVARKPLHTFRHHALAGC
jgi:hypothetical protein